MEINKDDKGNASSSSGSTNGNTSENSKPRFVLKKWEAVAQWSWDIVVDSCPICRNNISEVCIECQANRVMNPNPECTIVWGECNHCYHLHCISRWLSAREVCPVCNKKWQLDKCGK